MFRTIVALALIWTVLAGPFVAIAATGTGSSTTSLDARSMCFMAGIGCSSGPVIMPAISRMR